MTTQLVRVAILAGVGLTSLAVWSCAAAPGGRGAAPAGAAASTPASAATLPADAVHITGRFKSVNGVTEVARAMFGVHATWLPEEQTEDWGVTCFRQIYTEPADTPVLPGDAAPTLPGSPARHLPRHVPIIMETWYDRYQPALLLTDPAGWEEKLVKLARTYAANAKATGRANIVEFWNEPFVNWHTRPACNYDGVFYDQSAGTEAGKPMTIKGAKEPTKHLRWLGQTRLKPVDPKTGVVNYLAMSKIPPKKPADPEKKEPERPWKHGDIYTFRNQELKLVETPWGHDPTSPNGFSARQNAIFYNTMLVPFARALKETWPDIQVIAGWNWPMHLNDWFIWDVWIKPMIDQAHPWIDGVNEHHYGVDARTTVAAYEIIGAYALANHNKLLRVYNSETRGTLPVPAFGGGPPSRGFRRATGSSNARAAAEMTYLVRDILHVLDSCPDKAGSRTTHELQNYPGGELGLKLLKHLRGKLIETASPATDLWALASVQDRRLCVVLFNDSNAPRSFPLVIDAPPGTTLGTVRHYYVDEPPPAAATQPATQPAPDPAPPAPGPRPPGRPGAAAQGAYTLEVIEEPAAPAAADGRRWQHEVTVPGRTAVTWVFDLQGSVQTQATVIHTQHPAKEVLVPLKAGAKADLQLELDAARLQAARQTFLKLVVEGWNNGLVKVAINGQPVEVVCEQAWTNVVPLDRTLLKAGVNTVSFDYGAPLPRRSDRPVLPPLPGSAPPPSRGPIRLGMVSVVTVERP